MSGIMKLSLCYSTLQIDDTTLLSITLVKPCETGPTYPESFEGNLFMPSSF